MEKTLKIILGSIIIFTLIIFYSSPYKSEEIQSNILFVGGSGEGNYSSIQSAIDNATSGDSIYVFNGSYFEILNVNKSINIIGEDKNTTFIENAIIISIDDAKINGFTINNSLTYGLEILSNSNIITDNIFSNNNYAIFINASADNLIYHNSFLNNTQNAYDSGNNSWYSKDLMQGNFWDDYDELDKNNDGVGDTPYQIPGGDNIDKYPLMMPYDGTLKLKEFYIDYNSVFNMLIIGIILAIIFVIPIAIYWRKKIFK
jgi:parallel beta-helix repeat protein